MGRESASPMTTPEVDITGPLAFGGAGVAAVLAAAYKFVRIIRSDSRSDTTQNDIYMQLQKERERADTFAKERMQFSADVARLTAKVEALEEKVKTLQDEKAELKAEVTRLEADFVEMQQLSDRLIEEAVTTKVMLTENGHADVWRKIHDTIYGDGSEGHPAAGNKCAPARIRPRTRLSGNPPPLATTQEN